MVPRPITVSPNVARSMVEFAPISTSSSTRTIPRWGILRCAAPSQAYPKPSEPTTAPAWRMHRAPTMQPDRTAALGWSHVSSPISAFAPTNAPADITARAPTFAPADTVAPAATEAPRPMRAPRSTCARFETPALGREPGWTSADQIANAAGGFATTTAGLPPAAASAETSSAPARLAAAWRSRRGSATQERSRGEARSSDSTPASRSRGSPTILPPTARATSWSVKKRPRGGLLALRPFSAGRPLDACFTSRECSPATASSGPESPAGRASPRRPCRMAPRCSRPPASGAPRSC